MRDRQSCCRMDCISPCFFYCCRMDCISPWESKDPLCQRRVEVGEQLRSSWAMVYISLIMPTLLLKWSYNNWSTRASEMDYYILTMTIWSHNSWSARASEVLLCNGLLCMHFIKVITKSSATGKMSMAQLSDNHCTD